ncbi:MBL fold metallo-hydrolase [Parablautia intestinalis]|uniref:MBL fold metallo-hydrolase n=1 Tax=Parablautia intestinalis TaxID=2320100 RepID=UPI00256EEFEA|nr:MBL fold metallo-hydrolase [Parablautia intestinalis]MCI8615405.1 MBL fold metallo-hydrolase [Lachnospiraceae bacterium]
MRIINLVENTEGNRHCLFEHGLSFYVETRKHKLLVDTGASCIFAENARILGVDLTQIDMVFISHGHYDHTDGLPAFVRENPDAKILMQKLAKEAYYHKNKGMEKYIGMDPGIGGLLQADLLEGDREIDDEISLFTNVTGRKSWPAGNRELKVKKNGEFYQDDFRHEQYLVITQNGKRILMSGCAHNGILNILERYREIYGKDPDAVISGFHMRKKSGYTKEDIEMIKETAGQLKKSSSIFYTGHCTGEHPYQLMKEIMGEKLVYVHSGDEVPLPYGC